MYNSTGHPIPPHKATDLGKIPKKLAGGPAPDLEEREGSEFYVIFFYIVTYHDDVK